MKIHVPANFIGYGSFAFSAMVGVAYLLRDRAERLRPDGRVVRRLPSLEMLDDIMYRYIALGFAFFTLATILGALWAAEAWGGYWSWDPKETWALIVWLNYAAWLHMRFSKGWRGRPLAVWSFVGLIVPSDVGAGFVRICGGPERISAQLSTLAAHGRALRCSAFARLGHAETANQVESRYSDAPAEPFPRRVVAARAAGRSGGQRAAL
jgi:hypothetical protein